MSFPDIPTLIWAKNKYKQSGGEATIVSYHKEKQYDTIGDSAVRISDLVPTATQLEHALVVIPTPNHVRPLAGYLYTIIEEDSPEIAFYTILNVSSADDEVFLGIIVPEDYILEDQKIQKQ